MEKFGTYSDPLLILGADGLLKSSDKNLEVGARLGNNFVSSEEIILNNKLFDFVVNPNLRENSSLSPLNASDVGPLWMK